ncbi:hypothetical protein Btru_058528 [Bulinus truncatus]|nr:hypothetical protein Btru_058528 [Bulinus truncatus]
MAKSYLVDKNTQAPKMASSQGIEAPATPTRKSRRSWFDAPPLTSLDPPKKMEILKVTSKRLSEDAVESLILTHFTKPPKLNFGKVLIGKTKMRTLQVRNPHDCEQEVIIEKFPFKKQFTVNSTRFTVPPGDLFSLEILWTPEEVGGFREMIQLHVNQCYRLQAFVIGIVESPKPPRKLKDRRLQRRQGFGPHVKEPDTVIQTSALTLIKSNYSPRRSQDIYEEWMAQSENKENSQTVLNTEDRQDLKRIQDATITKVKSDLTDKSDVSVQSSHVRKIISKEDIKTPTPLESTVITSLQDKKEVSLKNNRKQWRNVSDITTPTLNTMSPIPHAEDNENGITVDSYFQPNETGLCKGALSQPENAVFGTDFKKTFIVPAPSTVSTTVNAKRLTNEKLSKYEQQDSLTANHKGMNRMEKVPNFRQEPLKETLKSTDTAVSRAPKSFYATSPKSVINISEAHTSPASPRTMLNQSLSLISQMKLCKDSSEDSDESVNCSVISLGKGIVSPNSFLADMTSMRHDRSAEHGKSQNTSTPLNPSPLSIMNNSIPHSVMVSHLESIRSSLNSPLLGKKFVGFTPKTKVYSVKRSPPKGKSHSISPKLKGKKKALMTSATLNKDATLSKASTSRKSSTPCQSMTKILLKKKEGAIRKQEFCKKSPKSYSLVKKSPKRSVQTTLLTKGKKKLGKYCSNKGRINSSGLDRLAQSYDDSVEHAIRTSADQEESNYEPHKSAAYFETSLTNKEKPSDNSSVTERGKLFPDIDVTGINEEDLFLEIISEEKRVYNASCQNDPVADPATEILESSNEQRHLVKNSVGVACQNDFDGISEQTSISDVLSNKMLRAIQAVEKSRSPQKFYPMSPSILPTSPCVSDDNFRRGTMTVTKSRPSDALLAAMNRKKLFEDVPSGKVTGHLTEDDSETQEKVNVRVEERYEEIDGKMYLVVKETTDIVKSITETYIEQLSVSPGEFLTPVRLHDMPINQVLQKSETLSHVDNKFISPGQFLTPIHLPPQEKPNFSQMSANGTNHQLSGTSPSQFLTPIHLPPQKQSNLPLMTANETNHQLSGISPSQFLTPIHLPPKKKPNLSLMSAYETNHQLSGTSPGQFLTPIHLPPQKQPNVSLITANETNHQLSGTSPGQLLTPIHLPSKRNDPDLSQVSTATHQLLGVSPSQFLTPVHLPNSPEPQVSRRSTHVVRSPKVLKLNTADQKCLDFSCDGDSGPNLKAENTLSSENAIHHNITTESNHKATVILSQELKEEILSSACLKLSIELECEEGSEDNSSKNCTKDSLETTMSNDSLNKSTVNRSVSLTEASELKVEVSLSCQTKTIETCSDQNGAAIRLPTDKQNGPGSFCDNESEDNFYDTQSENYYDALSDTVSVREDERRDLQPAEEFRGKLNETDENVPASKNDQSEGAAHHHDGLTLSDIISNEAVSSKSDFKVFPQGDTLTFDSVDRMEHFVVVSKESFEVQAAEIESDMALGSFGKIADRKHMRKSLSLSSLAPESKTEKFAEFKHPEGGMDKGVNFNSKNKLSQSKSAVLVQPDLQKKTTIKSYSQSNLSFLRHKSQSLTTLHKQDKLKSPKKVTPDAKAAIVMPKKLSNHVNPRLASAMKQKAIPKGIAQSRLILVKKPKTGVPRHPMPYAARNMYYDERWMEKQERGFAHWLNFVLTPPDEYLAVTTKPKVDAGILSLDNRQVVPRLAPTKEVLSFRAYAARRRLNRLRRSACELYQSKAVVNIICKIEVEVDSRRLAARKDKMIHADLGIRQRLLDLLLQYSSLWLRMGLETVFGEVVMLQSNQDVVGLSRFIVTRLLASPDIAAEFSHPTVPHLYKDGYGAAVARHTVKKFLLLVYFLDQAKTSRLIDHDPCLFCKDADIKSSKEILIQFSREVLSGEGDLTRHLAYLGYTVSHVQRPIDEFDFAVKNLSADLRDGLRLSRVLELFSGDSKIMTKIRTPAISRLQKIHNVETFFKAMTDRNFDITHLQVSPRDVVDGHREKTLLLLWNLIIHFQSSVQVNMEHLKDEIDLLTKSLQLKLAMQKIGAIAIKECLARRDSGETRLLLENEALQLIFQWCRLVCLHYGVKVENFTVSFSDGRAFCCLIHHYHPALLPLADIQFQTTASFQEMAEEESPFNIDPNCSADWSSGRAMPNENDPEYFEQLLANEKSNFRVLFDKLSELGGVPLMIRSSDMSNTIPDEKVVSTSILYLCARLLDIREEVKAARILQMAWRRKKLQQAVKIRQIKTKAAIIIQRWIRPLFKKKLFARQEAASICLQKYIRRYLAKSKMHKLRQEIQLIQQLVSREQAAQTLQCFWRLYSAKKKLLKLKALKQLENSKNKQEMAARIIQNFMQCWLQRRAFLTYRNAVIIIQTACRKYLAIKHFKILTAQHRSKSAIIIQKWVRRYLSIKKNSKLKAAAVIIQKSWRISLVKRDLKLKMAKQSESAVIIQKYIRRRLLQNRYRKMRNAASVLQSYWRMKNAKNQLTALKNAKISKSAVLVQSVFKCVATRRFYLKKRNAAVMIQKHWRRLLATRKAERIKREKHNALLENERNLLLRTSAAIKLQKHWRKMAAVKELSMRKSQRDTDSAIVIQKYWRGYKAKQHFLALKLFIIKIQICWRRVLVQRRMEILISKRKEISALTIQKYWKKFEARQSFLKKRRAVIVIQSYWRMVSAWQDFMRKKQAALILQSWHRSNMLAHQQRSAYLQQRQAAITTQCSFRSWQQRKKYLKALNAAVVIQTNFRCFRRRLKYRALKLATIIIQRWYRNYLMAKQVRQNYLSLHQAAITIQRNWRKALKRRQVRSAVLIQSKCRQFLARKKYLHQKNAAIKIQISFRAYKVAKLMRQEYLVKKQAALKIQSTFRMFICQREFEKKKYAVIVLQRYYRAKKLEEFDRKDYLLKKSAICTIQKFYKNFLVKRKLKTQCLVEHLAAMKIQATYRGWCHRQDYLFLRAATVCIQRHYRAKLLGRADRKDFQHVKRSVLIIQRSWRHLQRRLEGKKLLNERKGLLKLLEDKRLEELEKHKLEEERRQNAAVVLQRNIRFYLMTKELFKKEKAAKLEQERRQNAAIVLQRSIRFYQMRKEIVKKEKAAKLEQERRQNAAIVLQRNIRFYLMRKELVKKEKAAKLEQERRQNAAIVLQRSIRFYQMRIELVKKKAAKLEQERRQNAAIVLQRSIRFYLMRKELVKKRKLPS